MVQLVSVKKMRSPLLPDFLRIAGEIRFEHADPQTIWFDLPERFEPYLNNRGEPWLVLMLPCAIVAGENLSLDLPVDPLLLYNLQGVQRVWQSWYDWAKPIKIEAPVLANPVAGTETGLFFSGGVDSYFSLLGAYPDMDRTPDAPLSSLLMIWGWFDDQGFDAQGFELACKQGADAAGHFNKQFIPIVTNFRDLTAYRGQEFDILSHGAALAVVGHLVSNRFKNLLIAASDSYSDLGPWGSDLGPWGSDPLVDPQFSSAQTRIIHDGAVSTRVEKMERVCAAPEALRALQVCIKLAIPNCSACEKCLRTMVAIDLFDKQHLAESFDWSDYSLDRVAKVFFRRADLDVHALHTREAARERGRLDIVRALDRSLKLSKRLRAIVAIVSVLCKVPFLRRHEPSLRRAIVKRRVLG